MLLLLAASAVVIGVSLTSSFIKERMAAISSEYTSYLRNVPESTGLRLEYWQKSLRFIAQAPVIGHGTGSTEGLSAKAAIGKEGLEAAVTRNPHNQTLATAIQWGLVGLVLLYAMWIAHLALFRGDGVASWIGALVVTQNIFSSLLNSHLFDFHEGWIYVVGVGVSAGMLRKTAREPSGSTEGAGKQT
jgi:O-antigen ligase